MASHPLGRVVVKIPYRDSTFIISHDSTDTVKFRDRVRHHNPDIPYVPAGFQRYGGIMVLRAPVELTTMLGEAVLALYPWCKSVYQHQTTQGEFRLPQLRLLAGDDDPVVIHQENRVRYSIDLSRITFSGGNRHLRTRLVDQVRDGEFLVDMFAAVGNLSMQPLVHREITGLLIEKNPYTFSHLKRTLELNHVKAEIRNVDCRQVDEQQLADRIFMGYHDLELSHVRQALQLARGKCVIHLHPIVSATDPEPGPFLRLFDQAGANYRLLEFRQVKDFAPLLQHYELIIQLT